MVLCDMLIMAAILEAILNFSLIARVGKVYPHFLQPLGGPLTENEE